MSHVDEGQLHAYLDGGLSAMDAVRVERHLAECAPCRQRLEEARALVQRAARLLEWTNPPERAAPPLAELPPARETPRWRTPVAWAATIVLALGAGIYGGQKILNRSAAPQGLVYNDRVTAESPVVPHAVTAPVDSNANKVRSDAGAAGTATPAPAPGPAPAPVATPQAARPDSSLSVSGAIALRPVDSLSTAERQRADSARLFERAQNREALPDSATRGLARGIVSTAAPTARREASAPAPAPAAAADLRARDFSRVEGYSSAGSWPQVTRDSAVKLLGGPVAALPDLPIMTIRSFAGTVVVEQVIPPGQVVRLIQRRGAADQEASGGRANELLAKYVGALRVEIAGPFAADSLSKLLDRVRVMP